MDIRPERPEDVLQIHEINRLAFGQPAEANLVDRLRAAGKATVSLVAESEGRIVGHILFSPAVIDDGTRTHAAIGLAPMAVHPEFQRQGVGSLLVRAGLDECRRQDHRRVIVLGHPEYYPRFGFLPARRHGVRSEYDVPDSVFMALELTEGAFEGVSGTARYAEEFATVG